MRAREKREKDVQRNNAMYSIERGFHQADPKVVEAFNRSPYAPVLNFDRGEVTYDGELIDR